MKKFALVLLAVALILGAQSCKKNDDLEFNIVGNWDILLKLAGGEDTYAIAFSGSKTEGNWTLDLEEGDYFYGTYTVAGDAVELKLSYANFENGMVGSFSGRFESEDKISGTFGIGDEAIDQTGTWIATRK